MTGKLNTDILQEEKDAVHKTLLLKSVGKFIESESKTSGEDPTKLYFKAKKFSEELLKNIHSNDVRSNEFLKNYILTEIIKFKSYKKAGIKGEIIEVNSILNLIASIQDKNSISKEIIDLKVNIVSYLLSKGENNRAIEIGLETLKEARAIKSYKQEFVLLNNLGHCYWYSSKNDIALKYFLSSIQLTSKLDYSLEHFKPYNNAANIFLASGMMTEALDTLLKALKIAEDFDDSFAKSVLYTNLGIYYHDTDQIDKTQEYYEKSIEERKKIKHATGLAQILANYASFFLQTKQYEKSYEFSLKALEAAEQTGEKMELMTAYNSIGYAQIALGMKGATEHLSSGLKIAREINSLFGVFESLKGLAEQYHDDFTKCLDYALEAFEAAKELNDKRLMMQASEFLSGVYERNGDYKNALVYHKEMKTLNDILRNEEAINMAAIMQSDFDFKQAKQKAEILSIKNEELSALNSKLEKINSDKNDFLNIAAHDLRNPLSTIIGMCNFIMTIYSDRDLPGEITEMIKDINHSSEIMLELINKLLDINKIEEGRLDVKKEKFDIVGLVKDLILSFRKTVDEKRQILHLRSHFESLEVHSDKNIVRQIIINLLSNASKFSPFGSEIVIEILFDSKNVNVSVIDNGPGFPVYLNEDVFRKFTNIINKPTGGELSTGLGLSIVKKLSELIQCEIILESSSSVGSKFTLKIPVEQTEHES